MTEKIKWIGVTVILMALVAPVISRCGRIQKVASWTAPAGTWGLSRPLYLEVRQMQAFLDPFNWYPEGWIRVTDGGYVYVLDLSICDRTEIDKATVTWAPEAVQITFGSGVVVGIPKGKVMQQIGP